MTFASRKIRAPVEICGTKTEMISITVSDVKHVVVWNDTVVFGNEIVDKYLFDITLVFRTISALKVT